MVMSVCIFRRAFRGQLSNQRDICKSWIQEGRHEKVGFPDYVGGGGRVVLLGMTQTYPGCVLECVDRSDNW